MKSACPTNDLNGQWADTGMTATTAYDFASGCRYVVEAWGGAAADDVNHRMIVWGGGHLDYAGNEVFVLNLGSTPAWQLFLNPTKPVPYLGDGKAWEGLAPNFAGMDDGGTYQSGATPSSRHTYNGLQFVPYQNKLYSFGGSVANLGWFSKEVWTLDMGAKQWTLTAPYGKSPGYVVTAYNPTNGHILVHDFNWTLSDYDPHTNTWNALKTTVNIQAGSTGAVDPVNNWVVFVHGDGQYPKASTIFKVRAFDLSGRDGYAVHVWDDPSCRLVSSYGGLAWDSALKLMVGYPGGGNQLYLLNSGPTDVVTPYGTVPTHKCLNVTVGTTKGVDYPSDPGGVAGAGYTNGIFGRFAYFPSLDEFLLVNDATQNAWKLKLSH